MRATDLQVGVVVAMAAGVWSVEHSVAYGQANPPQVIQLPSVGQTTAGTSVSVPDGGRALIGGTSRSVSSYSPRSTLPFGRGPVSLNPLFGSPNFGRSTSGGSLSVSVHIHNLQEMDRAILGEGPESPGVISDPAEIETPRLKYTSNDYLQKAAEAEAKGKTKVAEIYRRLAEKHAPK